MGISIGSGISIEGGISIYKEVESAHGIIDPFITRALSNNIVVGVTHQPLPHLSSYEKKDRSLGLPQFCVSLSLLQLRHSLWVSVCRCRVNLDTQYVFAKHTRFVHVSRDTLNLSEYLILHYNVNKGSSGLSVGCASIHECPVPLERDQHNQHSTVVRQGGS